MHDHPRPRRSRSPSMGFPRRLLRPWGCEALEWTARSTKIILDLVALVEQVRLPICATRYPMDHAFCQTRSIVFALFLALLAPPFQELGHIRDRRTRNEHEDTPGVALSGALRVTTQTCLSFAASGLTLRRAHQRWLSEEWVLQWRLVSGAVRTAPSRCWRRRLLREERSALCGGKTRSRGISP